MDRKAWTIFGVICLAVLGGLIYFSSRDKIDVSSIDTDKPAVASGTSGNIADHVFGKADSKVVLVEYGDFQCPGCGSAHPAVKKVSEKYKDSLAFVFRNLPISSKHPNARAAATAAEAAGIQGKYWEMHNLLYENQASWSDLDSKARVPFFVKYATQLGLDEGRFKAALEDSSSTDARAISSKINFDQALAKKAKAEATPAFFLNGKSLDGNVWGDEAAFENAVKDALKAAGVQLPQ